MNKTEFIDYISEKHSCTKVDAERTINIFISSVTSALSEGKDISLIGFGSFSSKKREARVGRNPSTGASINIAAYNQPGFKVGKALKDACNV